jgi:NarL family two-component system response regulator LiaR
MMETIRVLVADDHHVVRKALCNLIASEPDMEIAGEAADGLEAVHQMRSLQPDVLLLDLAMPKLSGLEAILQIKDEEPGAHILVLTSFGEDKKIFAAIKAGAMGYLLKDSSPEQLLQSIRDVHRGELSLHPTTALKLIRELKQSSDLPSTEVPLTEREMEILTQIARGLTNQEIAESLFISERTVGNHISGILGKLHLANRTQAALYALRQGLANLDDDEPGDST